jgi:predicted MFS family arabinose efflux permease
VSFLLSAFFVLRVGTVERVEQSLEVGRSVRRDVVEGLSFVYRSDVLRALVYSKVIVTFSAGMFFAVYVLYMADDLGLGATAIGIVFATGGVGSLVGASLAGWLARRASPGHSVVGGQLLFGVFGLMIPLAVLFPPIALAMIVLSETLQWMTHIVAQVNELSIRQATVPDRYLGRTNSAFQFFGRGMTPLGALAGGLLGELVGVPATLVVASIGFLVAFLFVLASPVRNFAAIVDE